MYFSIKAISQKLIYLKSSLFFFKKQIYLIIQLIFTAYWGLRMILNLKNLQYFGWMLCLQLFYISKCEVLPWWSSSEGSMLPSAGGMSQGIRSLILQPKACMLQWRSHRLQPRPSTAKKKKKVNVKLLCPALALGFHLFCSKYELIWSSEQREWESVTFYWFGKPNEREGNVFNYFNSDFHLLCS